MVFRILSILILLASAILGEDLLSKFYQNDYNIKDVRIDVDTYNPKIARFVNVTTYKHNRTTPAVNASWSFYVDLLNTLEVVVQAYKFTSNEYRTFPIRYQVNVARSYNINAGGLHNAEKKCGYINGTYFIKHVIDASRLPPLIPSGLFKFLVTYTTVRYGDVVSINVYYEIYRLIYPPKSKRQ